MGEIDLKILIAPDLHKRALLSRSNGMKIFDKGNISSIIPFAAILTLKGSEVNKFFREMETPQHSAWEPGFHSDKKTAKKVRTELFQYIKETVSQMGKNNIADEVDDDGVGEYLPDELFLEQNQSQTDRDEIITDKTKDIEIKVVEKVKIQALTLAEEFDIIEASKADLHGDLIIFLFQTGMRKSEMINLKWVDFNSYNINNIEKWYIRVVRSKTKNGIREIPLTKEAKNIIDSQPQINEYIFNSKNGTPITKTVMRRLCERLKKETGVDITPHICRHTFATRLYESDADMKSLSEILGHSKVSFTMQRYVTPNFNKKIEAINLLEKSNVINQVFFKNKKENAG